MSKFRETLWFKRGETVEDVAADDSVPQDVQRPIEDRYVDDGSVTGSDRDAFSVRTGGTQFLPRVAEAIAPEPVDVALIKELKQGRAGIFAVLGTSAVLICAAIVLQAF